MSKFPIRDPDGTVIAIGSVESDITERKRAEEALKQKTALVQMLHRLAISANDAEDPDEAMQICLDVVCEYTGWPIGHAYLASADDSDRLTSSDIWHLDHPERFATFRDVTEKAEFAAGVGLPGRVLVGGEPAWIVDVTKDPNFPRAKLAEDIGVRSGFALPVLIGRDVRAVLEFFSDEVVDPDESLLQMLVSVGTQLGRVVERKEADEQRRANLHEIQTSRTRFSDAIESITGGFVVFDSEDRLLLCNTKYRDFYPSLSHLAVPGTPYETLIRTSTESDVVKGVTDIDGWVAQRLARHANPQGAFDQEQEDGRWTQINERRTEDGGTVIEYSDITERKHSEIELVRAKEEAEEATLMKGRFLANMSHELRTPLTSIKGSLSLIASGTAGAVPDDVASLVRIADDSAVSLVGLINDILDFEKIRAGQLAYDFEPLDIRGVVEQAIEANRAYGDQFGVTFHLQPAQADHLRVKGDRNRLIQVMTNLLSNAAKYSPGGGAVEISIESRAPSVRVSARDHGPGIPEEYRKNMFGEFYQVYEKGADRPGGTGLGLSIAKSIVESHGGSIDYATEAEGGTTFFFDLPELGGKTPDGTQQSGELFGSEV